VLPVDEKKVKPILLSGEYQNNLDSKGRLIIPAKLKDALGDKFMITRGIEKCLWVYPMESWAVMEEIRRSLDFFDEKARMFERYFFGAAELCEVDGQGRVLIPQNLRKHAGLEKEVYTIGTGDRLEIWDKQEYINYCAAKYNPETLSKEFASLGVGRRL